MKRGFSDRPHAAKDTAAMSSRRHLEIAEKAFIGGAAGRA